MCFELRFWSPRSDSNRRPSDYETVPGGVFLEAELVLLAVEPWVDPASWSAHVDSRRCWGSAGGDHRGHTDVARLDAL